VKKLCLVTAVLALLCLGGIAQANPFTEGGSYSLKVDSFGPGRNIIVDRGGPVAYFAGETILSVQNDLGQTSLLSVFSLKPKAWAVGDTFTATYTSSMSMAQIPTPHPFLGPNLAPYLMATESLTANAYRNAGLEAALWEALDDTPVYDCTHGDTGGADAGGMSADAWWYYFMGKNAAAQSAGALQVSGFLGQDFAYAVSSSPVPEPSSIIALLGGLGSLLAFRRRKE
jgi:hypothetical protein